MHRPSPLMLLALPCLALLALFFAATALAQPLAYVPSAADGSVTVFEVPGHTVLATPSAGLGAWGVAALPGSNTAYVSNSDAHTVSKVFSDGAVSETIEVGNRPLGLALSPDGSSLYVANTLDDAVGRVDTASASQVQIMPVGRQPVGLAVHPDGERLYVTCSGAGDLDVLELPSGARTASIPLGQQPTGVAVTPDGETVLATLFGLITDPSPDELVLVDAATNQVAGRVTVGDGAHSVVATPDSLYAYVSNFLDGTVSVVDLMAMQAYATIAVAPGDNLAGVAITPDGSEVWVADLTAGMVHVIETASNTVIQSLPVGGSPYAVGAFIAEAAAPLPLEITDRQPKPDATRVDVHTTIRVEFNQPMDPASFTAQSFKLMAPDGSQVPASSSYDVTGYRAVLHPAKRLADLTTYTVLMDTSVRSATGEPLPEPSQWSFTTWVGNGGSSGCLLNPTASFGLEWLLMGLGACIWFVGRRRR